MFQLRKSVFETNSSSTHSVSFDPSVKYSPSNLRVSDDGFIHVKLGDFGWEFRNYTSQKDRLSYLITMLASSHDCDCWWDDDMLDENIRKINDDPEFQEISSMIAAYTFCNGIVLDKSEGYIDHQSVHFNTIKKFLDNCGTDAIGFVFGNTVVHTGNDNAY